ncbi:MAG: TonB-system energizer ExbB, partial [Sulfurimonas sp.]|nr:TonB-system energizer ExbB [Sulfurimonas sp.]
MEKNILAYAEVALDYGVIGLLVVMSIVTLWLFIERMMFYATVDVQKYAHRDTLEMDLTDNISTISAIG